MKLTDKVIFGMVSELPGRKVLALFAVGDVYASLCKIGAYAPFSAKRRSRTRPVQKHKRIQDWRAGPFRSSSTCGEPQFWGLSEAMSAIRVPRTRRENTVQHEVPRSRAEIWIQARAAQGPERASRLCRGSPGLDSGPLGRPLFRRCTATVSDPLPPFAQTWHSKIEIRDQNRK